MSLCELYGNIPEKNSVIIIHRALLDQYTEKFFRYAKLRGSVLVYDTDDLLFDSSVEKYISDIRSPGYAKDIKRYKQAMQLCDVILVATNFLGEKAKSFHTDVRLMRNGLAPYFIKETSCPRSNHQKCKPYVTIAYLSGSSSHDRDFLLVEDALLRLLRQYPKVKILLAGRLKFSTEFAAFGDRFEYCDFVPYEELCNLFSRIDINLVPLETEQDFCQAKSELKYIEAGAFGIPSVVSPTMAQKEVVSHDVNGRLVENNDWYAAIESLVNNKNLRIRLGTEAQRHVLQYYSTDKRAEQWQALITNVWNEYGKPRRAVSTSPESLALRANLEITKWLQRAHIFSRRLLSNLFNTIK